MVCRCVDHIFYLNVPIGAAVLLLARRVVPESRLRGARRRYDPLGAVTVTATHSRLLLSQGHAAAAALTGGFQWAFWVSGLTALAAIPVTFVLIRRTEIARAVAVSRQPQAPAPLPPADHRTMPRRARRKPGSQGLRR